MQRTDGYHRMGVMMLVTFVIGLGMDLRLSRAASWLPEVPKGMGEWRGVDLKEDVSVSDGSRYLARLYTNEEGEQVQVFVIAPRSTDSYTDIRGCLRGKGYSVTAEQEAVLGEHPVREVVLRRGESRWVMCYWKQERSGGTVAETLPYGHGYGVRALASLRFGLEALLSRSPACLVRVYAVVPPLDPQGQQAQRNVLRLAEAVLSAMAASR
jgi:hypothetical protein